MGKRKFNRGKPKPPRDGEPKEAVPYSYENIVRENAAFEEYYKAQGIVGEGEWENFMETFRRPLPVVFRVAGFKAEAKALQQIIEGQFFKELIAAGQADGSDSVVPFCLPWYPGLLAWQLNLTRKEIRKTEAYVQLHNFLISETGSGNLSRQEAVSMIPPIVLDVQSHHKVLDMCAAPGSKTVQLIEMLQNEDGTLPKGLVVANDVDNKRCYMLVHQSKRLQSPSIVITNHDATIMPNIMLPQPDGSTAPMRYDRILCDVPCSGDGTLRKNIDIWKKWNVANAPNLHGLQYRIGHRGIEMLAVGGKMVYSTCSLNPLEDEAIIHRLLKESQGALELLDVSEMVPGLKYCQGLSHWKVLGRDLTEYKTPADIPEDQKILFRAALFPPAQSEAAQYHLERCMRILPHRQDTGAFFVAVLHKKSPLPWESQPKDASNGEEATTTSTTTTATNGRPRSPARKKRKYFGYKEDPYFFFEEEEPVWPPVRDFYKIDASLDPKTFFTRSKEGKKKNIYFVTPIVRDVVVNNADRMKVVNTGVKMFVRCDNKGSVCPYRLANEAAPIIANYIKSRKAVVSKEEIITLLQTEDEDKAIEVSTLSDAAAVQLDPFECGCCLLGYNVPETGLNFWLAGWKGNSSVRAFVPKNERVHYLRLCGADISKFEVNKFKEVKPTKTDKTEEVDAEKVLETDQVKEAEPLEGSKATDES